mgnify:CR=1 FL=1
MNNSFTLDRRNAKIMGVCAGIANRTGQQLIVQTLKPGLGLSGLHAGAGLRESTHIKAIGVPVIETHLSNPAAREEVRHVSLVGQAAKGVIAGFGATSYLLAIEAAALLANEGQSA